MFFQDEMLDTEIFDWYRIDEMFKNYYEKKRRNLILFPLEVTN